MKAVERVGITATFGEVSLKSINKGQKTTWARLEKETQVCWTPMWSQAFSQVLSFVIQWPGTVTKGGREQGRSSQRQEGDPGEHRLTGTYNVHQGGWRQEVVSSGRGEPGWRCALSWCLDGNWWRLCEEQRRNRQQAKLTTDQLLTVMWWREESSKESSAQEIRQVGVPTC